MIIDAYLFVLWFKNRLITVCINLYLRTGISQRETLNVPMKMRSVETLTRNVCVYCYNIQWITEAE